MNKITISASMLSSDLSNLLNESHRVIREGSDWLHLDVMDGHFVDNLTLGLPIIKSLRQNCSYYLDVHLMVSDPLKWIHTLAEIGVNSITFHLESYFTRDKIFNTINTIKSYNIKVGIALKPDTSINEILYIIGEIDFVLIMTVEPGCSGQSFMHRCLEKITKLREITDIDIQVDGGINVITSKLCRERGANILVSGSTIFRSNDVRETIRRLRN